MKQNKQRVCKWTDISLDEQGNSQGHYIISCKPTNIIGHAFEAGTGLIEEHGFNYCPYCGKEIKEENNETKSHR